MQFDNNFLHTTMLAAWTTLVTFCLLDCTAVHGQGELPKAHATTMKSLTSSTSASVKQSMNIVTASRNTTGDVTSAPRDTGNVTSALSNAGNVTSAPSNAGNWTGFSQIYDVTKWTASNSSVPSTSTTMSVKISSSIKPTMSHISITRHDTGANVTPQSLHLGTTTVHAAGLSSTSHTSPDSESTTGIPGMGVSALIGLSVCLALAVIITVTAVCIRKRNTRLSRSYATLDESGVSGTAGGFTDTSSNNYDL